MDITLGDFIDNIEKNGYPQIRSQLFGWKSMGYDRERDITIGACALGQGLWNTLHKYEFPWGLERALWEIKTTVEDDPAIGVRNEFTSATTYMNDTLLYTIPQIAAKLRELFHDQLDKVVWTVED